MHNESINREIDILLKEKKNLLPFVEAHPGAGGLRERSRDAIKYIDEDIERLRGLFEVNQ